MREIPRWTQKSAPSPAAGRGKDSSTVNTLPSPWRLSAWITPPMRSTRFLVMAMPSPVPWMPLVVEFSSRLKGSNTVRRKSGLMPMPLSRTIKRRWAY